MFDSRLCRFTLAATLAAGFAPAAAFAQTIISDEAAQRQQKAVAEAAARQEPIEGPPAVIELQSDKARAEEMVVELQQEGTPDEIHLKMKNDKERSEMTLILGAGGRIVKDKPYSAAEVTDTVQTLADGNRITHHWQNKYYRDASGRTRREQTLGALQAIGDKAPEVKIFIYDPVAKSDYVLDPGSKTARKLAYMHIITDKQGLGGKEATLDIPVGDNERVGEIAKLPRLDESRDIVNEDLGTRTIEGLACTGKRTTFTIRAGVEGNERPIVITRENWYSKDIEATVESTTNDPRSGETHYKLENVERGEQPLSLFELSGDYTLDGPKR